jgi:transposase InsO family protein
VERGPERRSPGAWRPGVGEQSRACPELASPFFRSCPSSCRLPWLQPSTGSPAGICTAFWPASEKGVWRRSSGAPGGPRTTPIATSEQVRARVIELRARLTADGLDAGPHTIGWHLEQEGHKPPAPASISRILNQAGLINPQPRKRPRSSYLRFEMAQPNEMWQSDFIHWGLLDGTDVEVLNWLDDHSRYLLSCSAHRPVTGDDVVSVFLSLIEEYGPPASTLTDNGSVYTSRFTGGRNAFEYVLPLLGIRQKNGSPGHPQTQGKTERFHQTLQRWLAARPTARTITELGQQLDQFREHYNERRPHRALGRRTPGQAYRATPKATPADGRARAHYRIRYDRLDTKRQDEHPPRRPDAPPRHRHRPRPQTRPRVRRRPPRHRR